MVRVAAVLSVVGVLLAGCGGEQSPAGDASAPATSASVESSWQVDAEKDAQWTTQLEKIRTKLTDLKGSTTEKAAQARTTQMISLEKVLTQMATAGGPEGIGHVACEVMPIQLLSWDGESFSPDIVGMQLGGYWTAPLVAAAGKKDVTYADVSLDERMQQECADIHLDVLEATGLGSLNDLYFAEEAIQG